MPRYEIGRWDPFRDLRNLQEDVNRLFGDWTRAGAAEATVGTWAPALDLSETDEGFQIEMDLPGMTSEGVEVTLDQNLLTIKGERTFARDTAEEHYRRVERRYGAFQRTVSLPTHVDGDGIQASFADGVLTVFVPKAEQAKPRKIKVGEGARMLSS